MINFSPALQGETFLRACQKDISELSPQDIAVVGIPHDVTKVSRTGASRGPDAIREATLMFHFAVTSMAEGEVVDLDAGTGYRYRPGLVVDVGDIPVGSDPAANVGIISGTLEGIVSRGALPVSLGGDHFVTYPVVQGVRRGLGQPLAYLHVDMHLDLADTVPGFGRYASSTPLRRLIEDGIVDPRRTLIFGVESFHHRNEWEFARDSGISIVTADQARRDGVSRSLVQGLDRITQGIGRLYASLDIDVLARSFAPGTGNAVGAAGLEPTEVLEVARELRRRPLIGLDVVEVSPGWDPTGRTAGLGATLVLEALWDRLFEEVSL